MTAGPYREAAPPRWGSWVEEALRGADWATAEHRAGLWRPGPAAVQAARELHPTLAAPLDTGHTVPAGVRDPLMWVQRLARLAHIAATVETVLAHHASDEELDSHPRHPLGSALAVALGALDPIRRMEGEIELLWARREAEGLGVAAWERQHVPTPLREQLCALEQMCSRLCGLCFELIVDPDEPR